MTIQFEKRVTHLGRPGVVTTTVRLVSREESQRQQDEFAKQHPDAPTVGRTKSFGESLRDGSFKGVTVMNPITGEEEHISYATVVAAFKGQDFDSSVLRIEWKFVPDHGGMPLYPSDLADEMRRRGFSEETIQELVEWEKTVRKSE